MTQSEANFLLEAIGSILEDIAQSKTYARRAKARPAAFNQALWSGINDILEMKLQSMQKYLLEALEDDIAQQIEVEEILAAIAEEGA